MMTLWLHYCVRNSQRQESIKEGIAPLFLDSIAEESLWEILQEERKKKLYLYTGVSKYWHFISVAAETGVSAWRLESC